MGMLKEIKVLLDFGASGRHHSLYDEILEAPPQGVRYIVPRIPVSRFPKHAVRLYDKVRRSLEGRLDLVSFARRLNRASIAADYDVVHIANHIDPVAKPFVVDFEQALSLLCGETSAERMEADFAHIRAARTRLMESPHCKFLLPWTMEGAKSLWQAFPSKIIKEKTQIVQLAMRIPQEHSPLKHEKFRVLFLGTANLRGDWNFYYRGGRTMLRVFEKFARGKGDVELVITGEVPECEKQYLRKIPKCCEAGLVDKARLEEIIRTSDALLYPSYSTPGLAFLEAMRHHVPIVTTDAWANREIIEHGVNGFVARFSGIETRRRFNLSLTKKEFTALEQNCAHGRPEAGLLDGLERLYGSASLRRRMGQAGFRMVKEGKFSVGVRNKALRSIYEECVAA